MIVTPCSTVSLSGESDAIVPSASNTVAWPAWRSRGAERAPREIRTRAFTIVPGRIEFAEAKVRAVVRIEQDAAARRDERARREVPEHDAVDAGRARPAERGHTRGAEGQVGQLRGRDRDARAGRA